jgi:heme exporter protein A
MELRLERVSKRFPGRRVFADVDAAAGGGQCLVVTGPNGSGKSTLLAIIAGLVRPSAGRVILRDGAQELAGDRRRDAIGMVAPDLTLYPELTAVENLRFFAQVRGLAPARGELESLLARVGLAGRGGQLVNEYSSGMRVRLKYAFALLHAPPVLLLDEPTANLDEQGIAMVEAVIQEQRARGIMVLATNEPQETRFADARIDLESGARERAPRGSAPRDDVPAAVDVSEEEHAIRRPGGS